MILRRSMCDRSALVTFFEGLETVQYLDLASLQSKSLRRTSSVLIDYFSNWFVRYHC